MDASSYMHLMKFSELLRTALRLYRKYFWPLILIHSISLIFNLIVLVVNSEGLVSSTNYSANSSASPSYLTTILFIVLQMFVVNITTAATTVMVSNAIVGRDVNVVKAFGRVLNPRLLFRLLAGSIIITLLYATIGLLIITIPFIIVWTTFFIPSLVLEKRGVFAGFSRSYQLAKGNFWRILLQYVIFFYLPYIVLCLLISAIWPIVLVILFAPVGSLILLLMYYGIRASKENFGADSLADDLGFQPVGEAVSI